MKIILVSFDDEGWICLQKILELNGNVAGVFTLRDDLRVKMAGNKAFDDLAAEYGFPLHKVGNINDESTLEIIRKISPDLAFVIGWSQLVKREFMDLCKGNCIGIHPTLLPKHRGRAPLPWAIIFGLKKTGVTMFYLEEAADSGDIIGQCEIPIDDEDDAGSLYGKTLEAHGRLMEEYFPLLLRGRAPRIPQDEKRASFWEKRSPRDGIMDWDTSADRLHDWIRGLTDPYPGAFTFVKEKKMFVWRSERVDAHNSGGSAGEVVEVDGDGLVVSAGAGRVRLTCVQMDGEERLSGPEIERSKRFRVGMRLG